MSALKQALLAVRELRAQVEEAKLREREPIAIVGTSCRFPGQSEGLDSYWDMLSNGTDAITEVPKDRWDVDRLHDPDPAAPGKVLTRNGGFIDDVFAFDAERFRISPREALSMDPQQRLILELAWNALEDAGIGPDSLDGSASGVFLGIGLSDYGRRQFWSSDPSRIDAYGGTGTVSSIAAGRIAYSLGFMAYLAVIPPVPPHWSRFIWPVSPCEARSRICAESAGSISCCRPSQPSIFQDFKRSHLMVIAKHSTPPQTAMPEEKARASSCLSACRTHRPRATGSWRLYEEPPSTKTAKAMD